MPNHPKHIVLTTIGSLGDLHPMIALVIELRRRGHNTTIATTEFYRQKIESIGIGFHPIRPNRPFYSNGEIFGVKQSASR
jgi:rhamnosyltransferase subunit B